MTHTPPFPLEGVVILPGAAAVPEYYVRERHWPAERLARRQVLLPKIEAYQASLKNERE